MLWRQRIEGFTRPIFQARSRLTRPLTLGVRGLVVDERGRVLLIEHTYTPGWHMPGGGVERGETAGDALARELIEEAGIEMTGPPRLLSVHNNDAVFPGDHVLLFRVEAWRHGVATSFGEVHAAGWFALDALPEATTPATRRRLAEALGGEAPDPHW